jgi:hypothetical protein
MLNDALNVSFDKDKQKNLLDSAAIKILFAVFLSLPDR